jgi:carbamate kinase
MRVLLALGGNAMTNPDGRARPEDQIEAAHVAMSAVADLLQHDVDVVITHGNGPQVGLLALEADAYKAVAPYPLDVLGAESQGMIGYMLAQALGSELPGRDVVALLTQVLVDPHDPGFARPTKPIGPVYSEQEAQALAAERGWTIAPDGEHFRRVVASPEPAGIVELEAIERLVAGGSVVICAGGGGIPVFRDGDGLHGVEAVIDKDLTAALLAEKLAAERLIMLTDVSCVVRDWGTEGATPISAATPHELRALSFASGSMGPKVEAACRFVEQTGGEAVIGSLAELDLVSRGEAGTWIAPAGELAVP